MIDVSDRGSSADLDAMPGNAIMTMSFSHEYIHFLQLISSNAGFRILGELVDFGVHAALMLAKVIPPDGKVEGYHEILPKLAALPDGEGAKHAAIRERVRKFLDEVELLFLPMDFGYAGGKGAWEIDQQEVTCGTYTDNGWLRDPRKPVPTIHAGSLGRGHGATDRSVAETQHGIQWPCVGCKRHRDGVLQWDPEYPLSTAVPAQRRARYVGPHHGDGVQFGSHNSPPGPRGFSDARTLESQVNAGGLAVAVGDELRKVVVEEGLLHADHYNEVMRGIMHGPAAVMNRAEYYSIHQQLESLHAAANKALAYPGYLAVEGMNWDRILALMVENSVPPVRASDGDVAEVKGIPCVSNVTAFLELVRRKLF
jgi:hypothetical protein